MKAHIAFSHSQWHVLEDRNLPGSVADVVGAPNHLCRRPHCTAALAAAAGAASHGVGLSSVEKGQKTVELEGKEPGETVPVETGASLVFPRLVAFHQRKDEQCYWLVGEV